MGMTVHCMIDDSLSFDFEVSTPKEAFERVATVQEIFSGHTCGMCGSSHVRYTVREHDGNMYYKLRCNDCAATLDFGQNKDGINLFPKRQLANGNWDEINKGWYKHWERQKEEKGEKAEVEVPTPPTANANNRRGKKASKLQIEEMMEYITQGAVTSDVQDKWFEKINVSGWDEMKQDQMEWCLKWARDHAKPF